MTQQFDSATEDAAKEVFGIVCEALVAASQLLAHTSPGAAHQWGRFLLLCGAAAHRQMPPDRHASRAQILIDQVVDIPDGIPSDEELKAVLAELESPTE